MNLNARYDQIDGREFEKLITSAGGFQSLEEFCQYFSSREWIFATRKKHEIVNILRTKYPGFLKEVLGRAEMTTENCFDILGSGPTYLGAKIDWHMDFKSGRIWKKDFFMNVPTMYWGDRSDAKVPWEISRFYFGPDLAIAHNICHLRKYIAKFSSMVEDWIYENPFPYGINWASSMEASVRAINWIAAYELFEPQLFTINFKSKFFASLYQHGKFIWENLANYGPGINNNHYLFDLIGLLVLGRVFDFNDEGHGWYEFAYGELENEIFNQVSPDGTSYESSLNYQIIMLELYLFAINFEKRFGSEFSDQVKARLMQCCASLYHLSKADNTVPNLGDSGSERLFKLRNRDERNICYLLELASVIIGLKGFHADKVKPDIELLWWCGPLKLDDYIASLVKPRARKEAAFFEDSGLAVMRHGENYLGFFANTINSVEWGGHKHNDLLAIEYSHGRDNFIVDSGTYVYTGDPSGRNYFRRTSSHSTLEVDGQEINRFLPKILFSIRRDAEIREVEWENEEDHIFATAEHSGYSRLENPVIVRRSIHLSKKQELFIIKDEFMGSGRHLMSGNLILEHGVKVGILENHIFLKSPSGKICVVVIPHDDWQIEKIPHYISKSYGQVEETWKLRYSKMSHAPQTCICGLFVVNDFIEIDRHVREFYALADRLGWFSKSGTRLIMKRGEERHISENEVSRVLTPDLGQIIDEMQTVQKDSE